MTEDKVQKEVITLVQLLFEQLKISDESNKEAIKDNTSAILELVKHIGDAPHKSVIAIESVEKYLDKRLGERGTVIEKIEELQKSQKNIDDKFGKLFWIFGIAIAVIGFVLTIFEVVTKFFPKAL